MLIPSRLVFWALVFASLSRRVNANSQPFDVLYLVTFKLIKKGEC